MRVKGSIVGNFLNFANKSIGNVAARLYRELPISSDRKSVLKDFVFRIFGVFLGEMPAYQAWLDTRDLKVGFPIIFSESIKQLIGSDIKHLQDRYISTLVDLSPTNPDVSIIIPVHNHVDFTLRCILAILESGDNTHYEIIIVDDASDENVKDSIRQSKAVQYLRNDSNLGYLKTCNKAVSIARGKYLVFLNNDTVVIPGWLDCLLEVYKKFPNAGMVGSKLLYPDGSLQEAGGIIWENGSRWNYGRGDDPKRPKYNFLREVDYCSSASFMIPRSIWMALDGYDEVFSPACYEDTDLAFRVRKAGYKVFYQPKSQVIHFNGISPGKDDKTSVRPNMEVNRLNFIERWKDALKTHGNNELTYENQYLKRYARGQVLFVDAITPTPDQDAGSVDAVHYLRMLGQWGFKVSFIPYNYLYFGKYTEELQKMGVECLYSPYYNSVGDYLKDEGYRYDLVVLSRLQVAAEYIDIVREYAPQAKILFRTVDLNFLREKREAEQKRSGKLKISAQKTEELELGIMRKAHCTVVVSKTEYEMVRCLDPKIAISIVTIPTEIPGRRNEYTDRRDIVFIGGYRHPPNIDAVNYFVSEIWPIVTVALPDIKFIIVGSGMPKSFSQLSGKNIIALGRVENLGEVFNHCRLSVAPLRFGAGVKGKIITSLSYGVPCVATVIGEEGMGLVHGQDILLADTEEDFANAIVELYTSAKLWNKLSGNGLEVVRERFSVESVQRTLHDVLHNLNVL